MSPAEASGLLRDLAALETRHGETPIDEIRDLLDEDPARGWRLLVEKYSKFVWSLAFQLSRGLSDPEEFAAEVYRRVFARLEARDFALVRAYEGRCAFRTYLYRVVRTERFRLFRRRGVERAGAEFLQREAEGGAHAPGVPESPWAVTVGRQAARAALAEMSDEDREILTLRFAGGLKLRELAEDLGCRDTNDAAYRVRRALGRCGALTRARASANWNEDAFRAAAGELRRLFPESVQKDDPEVSHEGEPWQEGES
jgi:RNA polymerase sigma factor (sigma-70 family)